jgi:hypothetical protein
VQPLVDKRSRRIVNIGRVIDANLLAIGVQVSEQHPQVLNRRRPEVHLGGM